MDRAAKRTPDHDLIAHIYATVGAPEAWMPFLDRLCADLGVASAAAQLLTEGDRTLRQVWHKRDTGSTAFAERHDRWINRDGNPRLRVSRSGPPAVVGCDRHLFADEPHLLADLNGDLARAGLGHAFWVGAPLQEKQHFSIILHRENGNSEGVSEDEESFLMHLLPHMRQAATLHQRMERVSATAVQMEEILHGASEPMLICDSGARILWRNELAATLLVGGNDLMACGEILRCRNRSDQQRLLAEITTLSLGTLSSSVAAVAADSASPIHLRLRAVTGASPEDRGERHVAITIAFPGAAPNLDPADVARLFGLTPAEARLAAAVAQGESVAQFAAGRGISVGTARIQLKQVFAKTGVRRQADLVRHLRGSTVRGHFPDV